MSYVGGDLASLFDPEIARAAVREMAHDVGDLALQRVRELAPVAEADPRRPPGTLKASYYVTAVEWFTHDVVTQGYEVSVESRDHVARWMEHGVKEHDIEAKPGRWLTYRAIDGELVRTKLVHHPGIKPQHTVLRALMEVEAVFDEVALPALERWKRRQLAAAHR